MSTNSEADETAAAPTAATPAIIDPGHDYTGPPPVAQSSPNANVPPKMVLVKKLSFEGTTTAKATKCSMFGVSSGVTTTTTTTSNPVMVFKLPPSKRTTPTKPVKLCFTSSSPVPIKPKANFTATPTVNPTTRLLQLLASQMQQPSLPVKLPTSSATMATVKQGLSLPQPSMTHTSSLPVVCNNYIVITLYYCCLYRVC